MKADLFWQKLWTLKRQKKHFLTNKAGQRKGEKNNELLFQFYEKKKKVQKLTFEKNGGETFWSLKNDFRLKICRDVVVDIFDVFYYKEKSTFIIKLKRQRCLPRRRGSSEVVLASSWTWRRCWCSSSSRPAPCCWKWTVKNQLQALA